MLSIRGTWSRLRGAVIGTGALAALVGVTALLAIGMVAVIAAGSTAGRIFPELLVDPYADFSVVWMPSWKADKVHLRYPDRLIAIDGRPLSRSETFPGLTAGKELRQLYAAGRREAVLTFQTADGPRNHMGKLRPIGAIEIGFFFGFYAVAALFFLWTGGMVLVLAGRRAGARAYALWSVGAYLLFISFYDYHTTCHLTFAFSLAGVGFNLGFLWLAYAFPARPRRLQRTLRVAMWAVTAAGIAGATWLLVAPLLHRDASFTRLAVGTALQVTPAILALSILLRLSQAEGTERAQLLAATWGLIATPVALAAGYALLVVFGNPLIHLAAPFVVPLLPLSIGVSLVRHNILNTSVLLSRRLLVGPAVLASAGAGLLVWLGLRPMLRDDVSSWWAVALCVPAAAGAFVALNRLSIWMLFRAVAQFRPTLEQLSDQLASVHELSAIRQAIEKVVSRWLPISAPVRVLQAHELESLDPGLSPDARQRLQSGEHLWLVPGQRSSPILIPMRSLGSLRGAIMLPPKRQDALYTTEDFTLLATIASLGAVAIHHADTLIELEAIRRTVVESARDEKRFALGLVGAELSHEIAYPLNFFRFLLKRCARGDALEAQDLEIGSEEVARLERMLDAMKKLGSSSPELEVVQVADQLRHAVELIREHVEEKQLNIWLQIPESLRVQADADMVVQIFSNLLRNSAQAVGRGGTLGVRVTLGPEEVQLECWDDGPGVPETLRERIWTPWVTTRSGGSGLGLAIAQRLAQKLGWRIALETRGQRTSFCVYIPQAAVHAPPGRSAA